ncbi:ADP-heptose:LPS heptosyltransferase [Georgenia satyanarayanai]|uniref:ADP-heptose:LPS heptosyltransferase n=1 Tax=Georgenia satyanarayanai TaxID=860221 RepID=A0A2Y9ANG1_9MICO|nr:glycosyltransferase family 9 protein [Georgenia satyanarayanai]PYF98985.1 ADP-heptose:LPS heptosyltransferase [Georgenia satyanarayanai]SSA43947.1 ADP-heptose:LPS heptosyltransferase [Georgenia satyanarayanai]
MALAGLGPGDVLVLRALGLGDALTGVAALRGVRRAWPGRRVVLAGPEGTGGWFVRLGLVDGVVPATGLEQPLAVGGTGGHVAVNLHGRGPQSHRLLAATEPSRLVAFACAEAGHPATPDDVAPDFRDGEHEVARWCRLLTAAGGECGPEDLRLPVDPATGGAGAVLLHPGAASGSRRWPAERWRELARRLAGDGHRVLVTGSAAEAALCREVAGDVVQSVAGELDVPGLAALVAGARLLVCGDTGVAHVATGVGTPSVLLFGPTPPTTWGPALDVDRHVVLWHGDGTGDPHADELDPALAAITVAEVEQAVTGLVARQPAH